MAEPEFPETASPKAAPSKKSAARAAKQASAESSAADHAPDNAVIPTEPPVGKTEDVKAKVKNNVNDIKAKAAEGAKAAAEKGKDRATEAVGSIGKLIRDSAATIDENVGKQYGDYARNAADAVDNFAGKIETKEVDEILEDARQFVRKSPAVAIGAAAAIGFVLARLVRSGGRDA